MSESVNNISNFVPGEPLQHLASPYGEWVGDDVSAPKQYSNKTVSPAVHGFKRQYITPRCLKIENVNNTIVTLLRQSAVPLADLDNNGYTISVKVKFSNFTDNVVLFGGSFKFILRNTAGPLGTSNISDGNVEIAYHNLSIEELDEWYTITLICHPNSDNVGNEWWKNKKSIYINGVRTLTERGLTNTFRLPNANEYFSVGGDNSGGAPIVGTSIDGYIRDFRVFNRALNKKEAYDLHINEIVGDEDYHFKMEEGIGNRLYDSCHHGYHATTISYATIMNYQVDTWNFTENKEFCYANIEGYSLSNISTKFLLLYYNNMQDSVVEYSGDSNHERIYNLQTDIIKYTATDNTHCWLNIGNITAENYNVTYPFRNANIGKNIMYEMEIRGSINRIKRGSGNINHPDVEIKSSTIWQKVKYNGTIDSLLGTSFIFAHNNSYTGHQAGDWVEIRNLRWYAFNEDAGIDGEYGILSLKNNKAPNFVHNSGSNVNGRQITFFGKCKINGKIVENPCLKLNGVDQSVSFTNIDASTSVIIDTIFKVNLNNLNTTGLYYFGRVNGLTINFNALTNQIEILDNNGTIFSFDVTLNKYIRLSISKNLLGLFHIWLDGILIAEFQGIVGINIDDNVFIGKNNSNEYCEANFVYYQLANYTENNLNDLVEEFSKEVFDHNKFDQTGNLPIIFKENLVDYLPFSSKLNAIFNISDSINSQHGIIENYISEDCWIDTQDFYYYHHIKGGNILSGYNFNGVGDFTTNSYGKFRDNATLAKFLLYTRSFTCEFITGNDVTSYQGIFGGLMAGKRTDYGKGLYIHGGLFYLMYKSGGGWFDNSVSVLPNTYYKIEVEVSDNLGSYEFENITYKVNGITILSIDNIQLSQYNGFGSDQYFLGCTTQTEARNFFKGKILYLKCWYTMVEPNSFDSVFEYNFNKTKFNFIEDISEYGFNNNLEIINHSDSNWEKETLIKPAKLNNTYKDIDNENINYPNEGCRYLLPTTKLKINPRNNPHFYYRKPHVAQLDDRYYWEYPWLNNWSNTCEKTSNGSIKNIITYESTYHINKYLTENQYGHKPKMSFLFEVDPSQVITWGDYYFYQRLVTFLIQKASGYICYDFNFKISNSQRTQVNKNITGTNWGLQHPEETVLVDGDILEGYTSSVFLVELFFPKRDTDKNLTPITINNFKIEFHGNFGYIFFDYEYNWLHDIFYKLDNNIDNLNRSLNNIYGVPIPNSSQYLLNFYKTYSKSITASVFEDFHGYQKSLDYRSANKILVGANGLYEVGVHRNGNVNEIIFNLEETVEIIGNSNFEINFGRYTGATYDFLNVEASNLDTLSYFLVYSKLRSLNLPINNNATTFTLSTRVNTNDWRIDEINIENWVNIQILDFVYVRKTYLLKYFILPKNLNVVIKNIYFEYISNLFYDSDSLDINNTLSMFNFRKVPNCMSINDANYRFMYWRGTSVEIDNMLIDLAETNIKNETPGGDFTNRTINFTGTVASRTANSDAAVALLISQGITIIE